MSTMVTSPGTFGATADDWTGDSIEDQLREQLATARLERDDLLSRAIDLVEAFDGVDLEDLGLDDCRHSLTGLELAVDRLSPRTDGDSR